MLLTPQQAVQRFDAIEKALVRNIRDAEMNTGVTGRAMAIAYSQGPYKTAFLRKHRPGLYSRTRPRPPADPGRVNMQSGQLAHSWELSQGLKGPNLVTAIFNESDHAAFIAGSGQGGSRMMHRPIELRIAERLAPIRMKNLTEAIQKALTQ